MVKPKQKSVTMWALKKTTKIPYHKDKDFFFFIHKNKGDLWCYVEKLFGKLQSTLEKEGYRAVKGKFVWEEKC